MGNDVQSCPIPYGFEKCAENAKTRIFCIYRTNRTIRTILFCRYCEQLYFVEYKPYSRLLVAHFPSVRGRELMSPVAKSHLLDRCPAAVVVTGQSGKEEKCTQHGRA